MAVLLKGKNGNEFEMGFVRDSYAEVQDGTGDSGWMTVNFRAATQDDSWEESAPCLSVFEFATLAEWLEAVARREPEVSEVELLEPELKFSVSQETDDEVTLRVGFHIEGRPAELNVDADTDAEYVDLCVTRENVLAAAAALRMTLEKLGLNSLKDDLRGVEDTGAMGSEDQDLNLVDDIVDEPPGAGDGEDNAGER